MYDDRREKDRKERGHNEIESAEGQDAVDEDLAVEELRDAGEEVDGQNDQREEKRGSRTFPEGEICVVRDGGHRKDRETEYDGEQGTDRGVREDDAARFEADIEEFAERGREERILERLAARRRLPFVEVLVLPVGDPFDEIDDQNGRDAAEGAGEPLEIVFHS